jgi:hypothetical protein
MFGRIDVLSWRELSDRVFDDAVTLTERVRRALRRISIPASGAERDVPPDEHRRVAMAILIGLPVSFALWAVVIWELFW